MVLLGLQEKYSFLSLSLLLTSGNQRPAREMEENTASEHLSHVQWDIECEASVMLGTESWHFRSCWANPPNAAQGWIISWDPEIHDGLAGIWFLQLSWIIVSGSYIISWVRYLGSRAIKTKCLHGIQGSLLPCLYLVIKLQDFSLRDLASVAE